MVFIGWLHCHYERLPGGDLVHNTWSGWLARTQGRKLLVPELTGQWLQSSFSYLWYEWHAMWAKLVKSAIRLVVLIFFGLQFVLVIWSLVVDVYVDYIFVNMVCCWLLLIMFCQDLWVLEIVHSQWLEAHSKGRWRMSSILNKTSFTTFDLLQKFQKW